MSSEFGLDHGLIHEAVVTGRKVGADSDFWAALAHGEALFAKVVAFVAEALKLFCLKIDIDRDMTSWSCVEPVEAKEGEFEPVLHEFFNEGEVSIVGEELVQRAKKQGAPTGLRHAEAMLREEDKIPSEWRKYVLVFPEVWQDPDGHRNAFYLHWDGDRWYLSYGWLRAGFVSGYRLVGLRKYQKKSLDS